MVNLIKHTKRDNYMHTLQEEMNNLIESVFSDFRPSEKMTTDIKQIWRPSIEMSEADNTYKIKAQLPGLNKEDINIELGKDYLTLKGSKEYKKEHDNENLYRSEFVYGDFLRTISFPTDVDTENAQACYKNGILTINIPKSTKEEETRKLEIKD